jgi:hypothetical protein
MPEAETGAALLEVVRTLRPQILAKRESHRGVTSATRRSRARISPCWVFPHLFSEAYDGLDLMPVASEGSA